MDTQNIFDLKNHQFKYFSEVRFAPTIEKKYLEKQKKKTF